MATRSIKNSTKPAAKKTASSSKPTRAPRKTVRKAEPAPTPAPESCSKQSRLISMLQSPTGCTLDQMIEATGWQPHSVRGVISGVLRKKLGLAVTCTTGESGRIYQIAK